MKIRLDKYTFGEVYNVEYIQDKFIIFCGYYQEKKFKLIVTDFNDFKKELIIDNQEGEAVIYGSKIDIIKKIDKNKIFFKSSDLTTKEWLSDLNIKVITPPDSIDNRLFNNQNYLNQDNPNIYTPENCLCDGFNLITLDSKKENDDFYSEDHKRISVFDINGTFIKHIPLVIVKKGNLMFQNKQNLKWFYVRFFENGIVISQFGELLYAVNIRINSIFTYTLKNRNYQVKSITKDGYILLSTNKSIQVIKIESDAIIEIAFKETKGLIRFSKILNNQIILCHSRIIAFLNISTLEIEKEIGTNKFLVNDIFQINENFLCINYFIRDTSSKFFFEREIKVINNFC